VRSKFYEGLLTVKQSLTSVPTDIEDFHIFTATSILPQCMPRDQCWNLMVSLVKLRKISWR